MAADETGAGRPKLPSRELEQSLPGPALEREIEPRVHDLRRKARGRRKFSLEAHSRGSSVVPKALEDEAERVEDVARVTPAQVRSGFSQPLDRGGDRVRSRSLAGRYAAHGPLTHPRE